MKKIYLYNTAHPMAEGGKPIFIPFGEWDYDGTCRQRLDRAHGERIANELNARVARGEPGIPVYQGHPDVPELAAKYPDKGALGWVTKIELANEGGTGFVPSGRDEARPSRGGLSLSVEWDRDPGKGFKWFSPYWMANEREGATHIVCAIASIGLVNNPNIHEFRLANERTGMKAYTLPGELAELAARRDAALANEANFDESKHPRGDGGRFAPAGLGGSGGGGKPGGGGEKGLRASTNGDATYAAMLMRRTAMDKKAGGGYSPFHINKELDKLRESHAARKSGYTGAGGSDKGDALDRKSIHLAAISMGLKYNPSTRRYE